MITRHKKNMDDIKYILNHIRKEDKQELKATYGKHWKKKTINVISDPKIYTVIGRDENNIPVAMGGYKAMQNDIGCVWFLVAEHIKSQSIPILLELKNEFELYDNFFWLTYNIIYKSNKSAKRWLKWLGFKFPQSDNTINPIKDIEVPKGFEIFYRIRPISGLGG